MIRSFSVIVPVMNKEHAIQRTLESVEASIQYFYQQHQGDPVTGEIVVINEGSSDRTPEILAEFCRTHPHCTVVNHAKQTSAGVARNTGANVAKGDILFFCDGDDLFYPEHIYLCYRILNHDPKMATSQSFGLPRVASPSAPNPPDALPIQLPSQAVGVVRTGAYMADAVLPYWKMAIENSIPQNVCVRRECHEFVEGFPENKLPYNTTGCEDISYQLRLSKFFKILKIELDTVEYIRYPGNNFDRQLEKFQSPPGQYQEEMSPETQALHLLRQRLEQSQIAYLFEKLKRTPLQAPFIFWLNLQQIGQEYMNQNQFEAAIPFLEQGHHLDPKHSTTRSLLAAAYNNLGSAIRSKGNLPQATEYYQKALALDPEFPPTDLAKVNFNTALILRDQQQYEQALSYLEKALELDPNFTDAIAELPKLSYQATLSRTPYNFIPDPTFIQQAISWKTWFQSLTQIPELKLLEMGCGDGRATCWLLENLLSQPTARITCLESFSAPNSTVESPRSLEQQFDANIAQTGAAKRVKKITGQPQTILRSLIPNTYHLAILHTSASPADVLETIILTWCLIKVGGMILFHEWGYQAVNNPHNGMSKTAIAAFLNTFQAKLRIIHQGDQTLIEKIAE